MRHSIRGLRLATFVGMAASVGSLACGGRSSLDPFGGTDGGAITHSPEASIIVRGDAGGTAPEASHADTGAGGDANTCHPATPGAWAITSSGLNTDCKTSTDCQAVYLGPNACETPTSGGGNCPNAAISASSYSATYLPEYEAINSACGKVCEEGSILCSSQSVACNGLGDTATIAGPGTCELISAIVFSTCGPDGPAVTLAFAPSLACTSGNTLPPTADTITLYQPPSGPAKLSFAPSGPNGQGVAQSCRAGVCVDAGLVILNLTTFFGGNAAGYYEIHLSDGTANSGTFTAPICSGAVVCGV